MEKSKLQKEFEEKGGLSWANQTSVPEGNGYSYEYGQWLEAMLTEAQAKATEYDRLMTGGKKTLKEIANIFGSIVAMDEDGRLYLYGEQPKANEYTETWQPPYRSYHERVPLCDIYFTDDWKSSLTFPDGWMESK